MKEEEGAVKVATAPNGSNPSLLLEDPGKSSITVAKTFAPQTGTVTFEADFMQPAVGNSAKVIRLESEDGSKTAVIIETKNNGLSYRNGDDTFTELLPIEANQWYTIAVVADVAAQTADVYINGELKADNAAFYESAPSIGRFVSYTPGSSAKSHYLDNLKAYTGERVVVEKAAAEPAKEPAAQAPAQEVKEPTAEKASTESKPGIYEAEDAEGSGTVVDNKHPGFTGTGFVDYNPNTPGGYLEWKVTVPADGEYTLGFRYSQGKPDNRHAEVKVNGETAVEKLDFLSTGDFVNYAYTNAKAVLKAGENTIRLTATAPEGGANVDHLHVYSVVDTIYEAEEAEISAAIIDNKHPGFTGSGFVDYNPNAPGGFIEWTTEVPADGEYTLEFRYGHGGTDNRAAEIKVNGEVVMEKLDFLPTGGWTEYKTTAAKAVLKGGTNIIRATGVAANGGGNIDHLRIHNLPDGGGEVQIEIQPVELTEILSGLQMKKLTSEGIIASEAELAKDQPLTRIAFMAMINEAYNFHYEEEYKGLSGEDRVWEVSADEWDAHVLKAAKAAGYIQGEPDGGVYPDRQLTRQEAAAMVASLLKLEANDAALKGISDGGDIPLWSKGIVGAVLGGKLMSPKADGSFGAKAPLTRGEAEELLAKIAPAAGDAAASGVHIAGVHAISNRVVAVTLNGKFDKFDYNDIALRVPTGSWATLTPNLTKEIAVGKAALATNRYGNTVVVFETVEPLEEATKEEQQAFSGDLEAAVKQAENYVSWQMDHGGWTKSMPYDRAWDGKEKRTSQFGPDGVTELGTIDNNATTNEIRFIAQAYRESGKEQLKQSVEKGLDFLLTMQYDTGGWPQVYPKRGAEGDRVQYSNFVTYNDGAMIKVLDLIDDILNKKYPFDQDWLDPKYYDSLEKAAQSGLDYILKSQIKANGKLTAWGGQHDPYTYEAMYARIYEHPSVATMESVGIVRYLMSRPDQTPEIKQAVRSALEWFDEVKLEGIRYVSADPEGKYFVEDTKSDTWYRFYEIGTNLPIFSGRDGVIKRTIQEIEEERRNGYSWGGSYAKQLLETASTTGYFAGKIYAVAAETPKSQDQRGRTLVSGEIRQVNDLTEQLNQLPSKLTVAKDGSGDYTTVQAAVDAVPKDNTDRVEIFIKNGTYKEVITVPADKPFISFIGESSTGTILTFDNYAGRERPEGGTFGTSGSASVYLYGNDFTAENLTFENSFDENTDTKGKQAVAVYTRGERQAFKNVRFIGNQDTLYTNGGTQYFYQCYIEGDVDFIFGGARAVFEECTIYSYNRGSDTNNGYVTAASTMITEPYGYLILNSRLESDAAAGTVHLGRPWHPSGNPDAIASVVYMNTYLGAHINPEGWTDMSGFSAKDARFFEYKNFGPGAVVNESRRQLTDEEAKQYTIENVLKGWNPNN